jgi:putative ABC transport system permease protein
MGLPAPLSSERRLEIGESPSAVNGTDALVHGWHGPHQEHSGQVVSVSRLIPCDQRLTDKARPSTWRQWTAGVRLLASYTAGFLWHERPRFLSAVLAVTFSAALISLQTGLVLGIYAATSIPIDHTHADVWVGAPHVPCVDGGLAISEGHLGRIAGLPSVTRVEPLLLGYSAWVRPDGTRENCIVIGSRLANESLGAVRELSPALRASLTEPGAIVVDQADCRRLGVRAVGATAEIAGQRVRIASLVHGLKGLSGPFVFCSLDTARQLLRALPDQTTYFLVACEDGPAVAQALRKAGDLSALTSTEFSRRTRLHWLTETPGGLATVLMAGLALLVGAVVTRQALYAATIASVREYALLRALGIRRRRIATFVVGQSLGVGFAGVAFAVPLIALLGHVVALIVGVQLLLPWWLLGGVLALTVLMALLSGLATLRSLRLMEPVMLLR